MINNNACLKLCWNMLLLLLLHICTTGKLA
jgi:hypothetical protein